MAADGALNGKLPAEWMSKLTELPKPPEIMSERIKDLLSRALMDPSSLSSSEIQELAASVVFHLVKVREEEKAQLPKAS